MKKQYSYILLIILFICVINARRSKNQNSNKKNLKAINGRINAASKSSMLDIESPTELPQWQKLQKRIRHFKNKKTILNMRFVQSLFDNIYGLDGTINEQPIPSSIDQLDVLPQLSSNVENFNEVPQLDVLEPTLDNKSQIDFESPKEAETRIMMNNYRFKEGEKLAAQIANQVTTQVQTQVQDTGYLQEHETKINTDGPTFMKGWGKFLHLDPKVPAKKLKFFLNMDWHENNKKGIHDGDDSPEEDDHGEIEIPTMDSFFFQLTNNGIFVTANRRNDLVRTVDSVAMAGIKPILKTKKGFMGGLEDQGNYAEGFCFRINAIPETIWVVCVSSDQEKLEWMDEIARIKKANTAFDKEPGYEGTAVIGGAFGMGSGNNQYEQTGPDGEVIRTKLKEGQDGPGGVDGYWVIKQDWSTCTLACGGGTQTQHRECVPPLEGGAPCEGEAILTKACNTLPCEKSAAELAEEEPPLPLAVKMMQVSHRPQRYETCVIKEGDLEVVRSDLAQFKRPPRVPARVALNNQTLTVFQSDHYDTVLWSAPLANVEIQDVSDDENCFISLDSSSGTSIQLCSLLTLTGINLKTNRDNWVQSIHFFQDKCHKQLPIVEDPIIPIKAGGLAAEQEEAKQAAASQGPSPAKIQKVMGGVTTMAIDAMSKEIKYESLIEKEELDRQKMEDMEGRIRLEEMKQKEECMERDMRKNSAGDRLNQQENGLLAQVQDMKDSIKQMILNQRSKVQMKLKVMKKLHDKKKRANDDDVNELKLKLAKSMLASHNKGDQNLCKPTNERKEIDKYCNRNFDTDPGLNQDCKDLDQFCYMCCENEFGTAHGQERRECFAMCENSKPAGGTWIWVPEANQVKNRRRRRF